MNERIQRNGLKKEIQCGTTSQILDGYDVYDSKMRVIVASVYGIPEAQAALERDVRMARIACGSGSCED